MKNIIFGNSLILLGLALFILIPNGYGYWPLFLLTITGFTLSVLGFFNKKK